MAADASGSKADRLILASTSALARLNALIRSALGVGALFRISANRYINTKYVRSASYGQGPVTPPRPARLSIVLENGEEIHLSGKEAEAGWADLHARAYHPG